MAMLLMLPIAMQNPSLGRRSSHPPRPLSLSTVSFQKLTMVQASSSHTLYTLDPTLKPGLFEDERLPNAGRSQNRPPVAP